MLGSKLEQGYYWYNDEYMYFSFNGHHSSKYHLFIQNSKELTIENSVSAASEYSNAMLQEGTYYLGTSRKQKTFKRKCAAEGLTLDDYRRMMNWLTVGTTGELVFDSDRYWGWTVVLDTVGDATFHGNNNNLIIEFDLTFKTIGTYLAHSIYPAAWIQPRFRFDELQYDNSGSYIDIIGTNKYHIPTILANYSYTDITSPLYNKKAEVDFLILDIGNKKQDFIFAFAADDLNGNCNFKIENNGIVYAEGFLSDISNQGKFGYIEYNSEQATLNVNDGIMDQNEYCEQTQQLNGMLKLNSSEPLELYTTSVINDTKTKEIIITLDNESWYDFNSMQYDYITLSINNTNNTLYSLDDYTTTIEDYNADCISYTGLHKGMYEKLQQTSDPYLCDYVGKYEIVSATKQIILYINTDIILDNNYVVYCGYAKHIKATLQTKTVNDPQISNIPYSIKVISYNNL